jgi:predicted GNAT superfamily acetyltransferase
LHRGLPTDRLIAEWWLESPRAVALAEGRPKPPDEVRRRVAIPLDIAGKHDKEGESRGETQRAVRSQFQEAFGEGLAAVGFELSSNTGNYLLGPWERTE